MTQAMYISALDWLGRGYSLLPIIPGTKYIVQGFGMGAVIKDQVTAARFFRDDLTCYNLAVVAPAGDLILDFDDWDLYLRWVRFVKRFDDLIVRTYTELTPSGGVHVFLSGELQPGYRCRKGVEIKRHCVVSPSLLKGASDIYEVFFDGPIYQGSLDACFFFLSDFSKKPETPPPPPRPLRLAPGVSGVPGRIKLIKGHLSIVEIFKKHYPKAQLKQRGRYYNCSCPFHADKNPSFYLDSKLNIFGCHACRVRGDVINLYALIKNIDNDTAIRDLLTYA